MRIVFLTHRYSRTGAIGLQHLVRHGVDVAAVVTPVVRYKSGGMVGSVLQLIRRRGFNFSARTITRVMVCMIRGALAGIPGVAGWLGDPWSVDEVPVPPTTQRLNPPDVNAPSFVSTIAAMHADLLVICISDRIVRAPLLAATRCGGINVHPAPLPKYRGPDPLYWQLAHRESTSAVTVHVVTATIDGGAILVQEPIDLRGTPSERSFKHKVDAMVPAALMKAIDMVRDGVPGTIQDETAATYFPERPRGW